MLYRKTPFEDGTIMFILLLLLCCSFFEKGLCKWLYIISLKNTCTHTGNTSEIEIIYLLLEFVGDPRFAYKMILQQIGSSSFCMDILIKTNAFLNWK